MDSESGPKCRITCQDFLQYSFTESPTVLRVQSKQFPIPQETRGTKTDHEGSSSVGLLVRIPRGAWTRVSTRPMKKKKKKKSDSANSEPRGQRGPAASEKEVETERCLLKEKRAPRCL